MPRSRKRRRPQQQSRSLPSLQHEKSLLSAIEAILPPDQEILLLYQFLSKYAPNLKINEQNMNQFSSLVLAPLDSITVSPSLRTVECREPLPGLVDDCVWSLVMRREKWRRLKEFDRKRKFQEETAGRKRRKISHQMTSDKNEKENQLENGRNVLAQGYAAESVADLVAGAHRRNHFEALPVTIPPLMRPGVVCIQPNDKVSICKSSITFQRLHESIGDELLRTILLHTRLFLPLSALQLQQPTEQARSADKHQEENFLMVSGPPIYAAEGKAAIKGAGDGVKNRPHTKRSRKNKLSTSMDENRFHPNGTLSRRTLYYSNFYVPKIGLPQNHIFQLQTKSAPTRNGATILLRKMILSDSSGKKTTQERRRWKRVRDSGVDICYETLLGHRKCDYARKLNQYCAIPENVMDMSKQHKAGIKADQDDLEVLAHSYVSSESVASFLISVLKAVFPSTFWGSDGNFDAVVHSVRHFMTLRRYEKLTNKNIMHAIKITRMSWLVGSKRSRSSWTKVDHEVVTSLTLGILRWVFRGFLIPLLRACFHVTESEFGGKKLLYYRKPVWSIFRAISMKKLLQKQFSELSIAKTRQLLSQQRIGFSQLRFLPKATGVRPISQLSRPPVFPFSINYKPLGLATENAEGAISGSQEEHLSELHKKLTRLPPTNTTLSEAFHVLKYECSQRNNPFGFGLPSLSDFYPKYRDFLLGLTKPRKNLMLRFAKVDIEKCFDSINQEHLLKLLNELISRDRYFIQQFNRFRFDRSEGDLEIKTKKIVDPIHQDLQSISENLRHVVVDSRNCNVMSRIRVLELLKEHIYSNLVAANGRYGKRALLQSAGIPQGSMLSTLLCNLYYGSVEGSLLKGMKNTKSLIARQVDDFLCVSTESNYIREFLDRMDKGDEGLGVKVNKEKTVVSFSPHEDGDRIDGYPICESKNIFPWCGMLFDTMSGEVSMDYSRFARGMARDSLSVRREGNEGRGLRSRMRGFILPRCIPILYDSAINSFDRVVNNFYQMMLYTAIKMAEYLRSSRMLQSSNPKFLLNLIDGAAEFSATQIRAHLRRQQLSGRSCSLVLNGDATCWVTWRAFHDIFLKLHDFNDFSKHIEARYSSITPLPSIEGILRKAHEQIEVLNMISF